MLSQIGGVLGLMYCLYKTLFRWDALVGKYGTLGRVDKVGQPLANGGEVQEAGKG